MEERNRDGLFEFMAVIAMARMAQISPKALMEKIAEGEENEKYVKDLTKELVQINLKDFEKELNKKDDNPIANLFRQLFKPRKE